MQPPEDHRADPPPETAVPDDDGARTMIPARTRRAPGESVLMRVVATAGIIGIGVAIAAILASQHVQGWILGLAVSLWSVVFAAVLWSSRRM